jgi:hypothetical protein
MEFWLCWLLLAGIVSSTGNVDDASAWRRADTRAAFAIHAAAAPSSQIGSWVKADGVVDWLTTNFSTAHLSCLNTERQGNCYDDEKNMKAADVAKHSRHNFMARAHSEIRNGRDTLEGRNYWAWRLAPHVGDVIRTLYHPATTPKESLRESVDAFVRSGARFVVVGDSLSRQFAKTLECSLSHKLELDLTKIPAVVFLEIDTDVSEGRFSKVLNRASVTTNDVVVVNVGHHIDPSKSASLRAGTPPHWQAKVQAAWRGIFATLAATKLDPLKVFVRTTTVRFNRRDAGGDWEGGAIVCGGSAPDDNATWASFGGKYPSQPKQNELVLKALDHTSYQLFDVAPLALARADTTFDCSHHCLPGDMDIWVSLLLARLFEI